MSRKPFVVCLMDGMGIEDAKSYNIYSSDVMPTLDAFTNHYLFTTINSSGRGIGLSEDASATRDIGLLNIGACSIVKQSIEIINSKINDNLFFSNSNFNKIVNHVNNNGSSFHLISVVGDKYGEDSFNHIRKTIEYLNSVGIKKIFIHLFLGANNNSLNKSFIKYTSNLHRLLNLFPDVKVGIIAGLKFLKDSSGITVTKELYKISVGGIGEHWINYNDAVSSNYKRNNLEENIVPFIVDDTGIIKNNDGVFLFNYENDLGSVYCDMLVNPSKYMYTNINNVNVCVGSLFDLRNDTTLSCFQYDSVKTSFYSCLNKNNIKHLLIAEKDIIPYINYFFNGCNNTQATQFLSIDVLDSGDYDTNTKNRFDMTTNKLLEAINSNFYDLIIVNYSVITTNKNIKTDNIKNSLIYLDNSLNTIYKSVSEKDGILYITSSYGLNEVLYNAKDELVSVDFSKKVPFVIIDKHLSKDNNTLIGGNLSDISSTILSTLGVTLDEGMTGRNLLLYKNSKSKKKSSSKIIIIFLIMIIVVGLILVLSLGLI